MTDDTAIAELADQLSGWINSDLPSLDIARRIHAAGWRRPGAVTDAQVEAAAQIMGLEPDDETVCSCENCRESRTIANAGTRQVARAVLEAAAVPAVPEWRPIEGAPRDEDEIPILIARIGQEQYPSYRVAYFDHEARDPDYPWHVEDAARGFNHHKDWPTHYMLLPISPKAS